jgi:uncharacterized OB-fold protein
MTFQRCAECGHAWLPTREECPKCWSPDWRREEASGEAKVVSWVVYHTAFDKRFAERLPYNVALVELAEGPRMITNLVEIPAGADVIVCRGSACGSEGRAPASIHEIPPEAGIGR